MAAVTARDVLREALRQGLIDSTQAKACVDAIKSSGGARKLGDVLKDVGGLDASQVRGIVATLQNGGAAPPPDPEPEAPVRRPPRRSRLAQIRQAPPPGKSGAKVAAIIAFVVLVLGGGAFAIWKFTRPETPAPKPEPTAANPEPQKPILPAPPDNNKPPVAGAGDFKHTKDDAEVEVTLSRFGNAARLWDALLPRLKDSPDLEAKAKEERQKVVDEARRRFDCVATESDEVLKTNQFDAAHRELARLLKFDLPEITTEVWKKIDAISEKEIAYINTGSADLVEAKKKRETLEAKYRGPDEVRYEVWKKLRARDFDGATEIVNTKAPMELQGLRVVANSAKEMDKTIAKALAGRLKEGLLLEFEKGEDKENGTLKAVDGTDLTVEIDGKEEKRAVEMLTWKQKSELTDNPFYQGTALLLAGDAAEARVRYAMTGDPSLDVMMEDSPLFSGFSRPQVRHDAKKDEEDLKYKDALKKYTLLWLSPTVEDAKRHEDLYDRARCWLKLGQYATALLDVETLMDAGEVTETNLGLLGAIYSRQALLEAATTLCERTREKNKDNAKLYDTLLGLYAGEHRYEDIEKLLKEAPEAAKSEWSYGKLSKLMPERDKIFPSKPAVVAKGQYIVETDLGPEMAQKIADFMGDRYAEYSRGFPFTKNDSLKFVVKVFAKRADFDRYTDLTQNEKPGGVADVIQGYYLSWTNELVTYEHGEDTWSTLRHEGFHQFVDYFVPGCPMWFNEGFASYFETSTVDKPVFNVSRMREAQAGFSTTQISSFAQLTDNSNWHVAKSQALMYGQSWSFIYYLIDHGRRDCLDRYFRMMMRGMGSEKAYQTVFNSGMLDTSDVETDWKKWVKDWKPEAGK